MTDLLRMDYINSLPQPFLARFCGDKDTWWPVHCFGVDAAVCLIDVCGKLQGKRFCEIMEIIDGDGVKHDPEQWWVE